MRTKPLHGIPFASDFSPKSPRRIFRQSTGFPESPNFPAKPILKFSKRFRNSFPLISYRQDSGPFLRERLPTARFSPYTISHGKTSSKNILAERQRFCASGLTLLDFRIQPKRLFFRTSPIGTRHSCLKNPTISFGFAKICGQTFPIICIFSDKQKPFSANGGFGRTATFTPPSAAIPKRSKNGSKKTAFRFSQEIRYLSSRKVTEFSASAGFLLLIKETYE